MKYLKLTLILLLLWKDTIIIMEKDYYVNNKYGKLEIIEKLFNLKNIVKYIKGS